MVSVKASIGSSIKTPRAPALLFSTGSPDMFKKPLYHAYND